jgi:hypothetical protein
MDLRIYRFKQHFMKGFCATNRVLIIVLTFDVLIISGFRACGAANCPDAASGTGDTTIDSPEGSSASTSNSDSAWLYLNGKQYWDFQAVLGGPLLTISGSTGADEVYSWTLDTAAGSLEKANTSSPTHKAPDDAVEGWLKLFGSDADGCDKRKVKVYGDCFARDSHNFEVGQPCEEDETCETPYGDINSANWNCHGSCDHALGGNEPFINWSDETEDAPDYAEEYTKFKIADISDWDNIQIGRGDIVTFWKDGGVMHSSISLGSKDEMWGANNNTDGDRKWGECSVEDYVDAHDIDEIRIH